MHAGNWGELYKQKADIEAKMNVLYEEYEDLASLLKGWILIV